MWRCTFAMKYIVPCQPIQSSIIIHPQSSGFFVSNSDKDCCLIYICVFHIYTLGTKVPEGSLSYSEIEKDSSYISGMYVYLVYIPNKFKIVESHSLEYVVDLNEILFSRLFSRAIW